MLEFLEGMSLPFTTIKNLFKNHYRELRVRELGAFVSIFIAIAGLASIILNLIG